MTESCLVLYLVVKNFNIRLNSRMVSSTAQDVYVETKVFFYVKEISHGQFWLRF